MRLSKEEERALARYFEENRDNPAIWDTKPIKIRVRRGGPSAVFSVRFTPEELKLLQLGADERRITISQLIREAALREVTRQAADIDDLGEASLILRRIADLISSPDPAKDLNTEMAESFVPGKIYTNVPRPIEAPVFEPKRSPDKGDAGPKESASAPKGTRRKTT